MSESDIFEPYERLVPIEICGKTFEVPENNRLLRCFQFLWLETISVPDFCWNGTCDNCRIWLEASNTGKPDKPVLACRTTVKSEMKIVRMSDAIKPNF